MDKKTNLQSQMTEGSKWSRGNQTASEGMKAKKFVVQNVAEIGAVS